MASHFSVPNKFVTSSVPFVTSSVPVKVSQFKADDFFEDYG